MAHPGYRTAAVLDDWLRARPRRVQSYAGKGRAYWHNLGFANLTRVRIPKAITRELRRNKYGSELVPDCMVDLAQGLPRRM